MISADIDDEDDTVQGHANLGRWTRIRNREKIGSSLSSWRWGRGYVKELEILHSFTLFFRLPL